MHALPICARTAFLLLSMSGKKPCVAPQVISSSLPLSKKRRKPASRLLPRARELARQILNKPPLTVRYARVVMTQELKKLMLEHLSHGLALQGLAANEYWPS